MRLRPYWRLKPEEVSSALRLLGLTLPVHIEVAELVDDAGDGRIVVAGMEPPENGVHRVFLDFRVAPWDVCKALMHELRHCQQWERGHPCESTDGGTWEEYKNDPLERECEAAEELVEPGDLSRPALRGPLHYLIGPQNDEGPGGGVGPRSGA